MASFMCKALYHRIHNKLNLWAEDSALTSILNKHVSAKKKKKKTGKHINLGSGKLIFGLTKNKGQLSPLKDK
jgi:hypothetical protein